MKLSKETIAMLKNFATINGNLLIKPGSSLSTIAVSGTTYAAVDVKEDFDTKFGIYDLNEFLGVLTLFDDPDIQFGDKFAVIKEGRNSIKYYSADETVLTVPSKAFKLSAVDIEFDLTSDNVNMIIKTAGVLRAPDIMIKGDGTSLKVVIGDKKNSSGNAYEMVIGETDSTFSANLRIETFKVVPGNYKVEIAARKAVQFSNGNLKYIIGLEADSVFED
jgi:hypothetical protein